ncbi:PTS sugar transporter subunit IIA [Lactobacillus sp. ESL0731]|uniref:PTS sugar transporter subunit IIA n=1 Tax=unclassified Lactobacillus TaxID=2620435 RepID=UPI0023F9946F|nr:MULTISPECIES: PTS sugar transporter subunit IIA [unclassified Lactobacillus]WEV51441.1 PTS sugar transporter subunit IIA [Lactobacillus sp. ESL0700]WEV62570.1 PTS sugar transporter subunit IIA [Lactobacillus sp. ESL0731]
MDINNLFSPDAVFVSEAESSTAVFKEVSHKLFEEKCVKDCFFKEITERESSYPTGIDTSPISKELPNIAVPHTEGEFVNTRLIVPVGLKTPVCFKNMIAPDQDLQVKFLFMILNNDPEGQANILAQIMDFLRLTPVPKLQKLFNFTSTDKIYQFMSENFKK